MKWNLTTLIACFAFYSHAASWQSPTCSYTDVTNTIAKASFGDTVLLPVGTNYWPNTILISGITLQGQGTNSTLIMDETPVPVGGSGGGTPIVEIFAVTNSLTRLCNIQFSGGITNNVNTFPNNFGANIVVTGGVFGFRIDDCFFNLLTGKNVFCQNDTYGVLDHDSFLTQGRICLEVYGNDNNGDPDWAAPTMLGSQSFVFFENSEQVDTQKFGWIDVSGGGRCVCRNSTLIGAFFNTHGSETPGRPRSARAWEIYGNFITHPPSGAFDDFYTGVDVRGGTGVIWGNVFSNVNTGVILDHFRATDNDPGFAPWWGATGINGFDNNGPILLSAFANATSNALFINGANWTNTQWVGCTVYNSNSIAGFQVAGLVSANNSNTMFFEPSRSPWLQAFFTNGDPIVVHRVYPMIDQPGAAQGGLLSGFNPTPAWPNQVIEPIYCYSNTVWHFYDTPVQFPQDISNPEYPNLVNGRDYTNGVAKPGYAPYTYPHPLTQIGALPDGSIASRIFKL